MKKAPHQKVENQKAITDRPRRICYGESGRAKEWKKKQLNSHDEGMNGKRDVCKPDGVRAQRM